MFACAHFFISTCLSCYCDDAQMRKEELRQLRARQAAHADVEEDALLRKFNGSVTLTFRADRTVTLTPQQARAQLRYFVDLKCLRNGCFLF